jgi:UPF0716 family protein affecting phage T7 exclusion
MKRFWRALPASVRKTIALVIGSTLIAIGGILVILPGPFTMPFVFAGLVVLAAEFVWAERLLVKAKHHARKVDPRNLRRFKK